MDKDCSVCTPMDQNVLCRYLKYKHQMFKIYFIRYTGEMDIMTCFTKRFLILKANEMSTVQTRLQLTF